MTTEPKFYTITVDGVEYKSTSPLTPELVRRKMQSLNNSGAFGRKANTADEAEAYLVKM